MGKGVLLGTLFSILNFVIMGETLSSRMAPTEGRRLYLALGSIAVRYALLAIPLVLAIRLEMDESVWANREERDEVLGAMEAWAGGPENEDHWN